MIICFFFGWLSHQVEKDDSPSHIVQICKISKGLLDKNGQESRFLMVKIEFDHLLYTCGLPPTQDLQSQMKVKDSLLNM